MKTTTKINKRRTLRRIDGQPLKTMPFVRVTPPSSLDRRRLFKGLPQMPIRNLNPF